MRAEQELFSNVHQSNILGFDVKGDSYYQEVCKFLSLTNNDVAKMAGISENSVRFGPRIPISVKERLDQIANICQLVAEHFGEPHKAALWFQTVNPFLGNISPRDMIRYGRYKRLMQFIIDARRRSGVSSESAAEPEKEKSKF